MSAGRQERHSWKLYQRGAGLSEAKCHQLSKLEKEKFPIVEVYLSLISLSEIGHGVALTGIYLVGFFCYLQVGC